MKQKQIASAFCGFLCGLSFVYDDLRALIGAGIVFGFWALDIIVNGEKK